MRRQAAQLSPGELSDRAGHFDGNLRGRSAVLASLSDRAVQEREPEAAVHLLSFAPARTGRDEPDGGDEEESLNLGDSHTVRNRRSRHTPAATTATWSEMEIASSAKAKRHSANQGRYSA